MCLVSITSTIHMSKSEYQSSGVVTVVEIEFSWLIPAQSTHKYQPYTFAPAYIWEYSKSGQRMTASIVTQSSYIKNVLSL